MATPPSQSNQYAIIKVRFKAVETNSFGFFLIFLEVDLRRCESVTALVSHFSSLYEIDPKENWALLEERLMELRWKGEFAAAISRDTQTSLENALTGMRAEEFSNLVKSNGVSKMATLLAMILAKPLGDKNVYVDLTWENVSKDQIEEVKLERERRSMEEAAANEADMEGPLDSGEFNVVEEGSVVLSINFVLSPVSGIPIHELKIGDRIMVKIDPSSKRGSYFIDLLNAKQNDRIMPIPATVTELKTGKSNNEHTVLVKLGEGVYGKVSETEQVKIKRAEPGTDNKAGANAQANLKSSGSAGGAIGSGKPKEEATSGIQWLIYIGGFLLLGTLLLIVTGI
jgi:hypothetical protein